jgi:hypothetical protein
MSNFARKLEFSSLGVTALNLLLFMWKGMVRAQMRNSGRLLSSEEKKRLPGIISSSISREGIGKGEAREWLRGLRCIGELLFCLLSMQ